MRHARKAHSEQQQKYIDKIMVIRNASDAENFSRESSSGVVDTEEEMELEIEQNGNDLPPPPKLIPSTSVHAPPKLEQPPPPESPLSPTEDSSPQDKSSEPGNTIYLDVARQIKEAMKLYDSKRRSKVELYKDLRPKYSRTIVQEAVSRTLNGDTYAFLEFVSHKIRPPSKDSFYSECLCNEPGCDGRRQPDRLSFLCHVLRDHFAEFKIFRCPGCKTRFYTRKHLVLHGKKMHGLHIKLSKESSPQHKSSKLQKRPARARPVPNVAPQTHAVTISLDESHENEGMRTLSKTEIEDQVQAAMDYLDSGQGRIPQGIIDMREKYPREEIQQAIRSTLENDHYAFFNFVKLETKSSSCRRSGPLYFCREKGCPNRAYPEKTTLLCHILRDHFGQLRLFRCDYCTKRFYTRKNCLEHIRQCHKEALSEIPLLRKVSKRRRGIYCLARSPPRRSRPAQNLLRRALKQIRGRDTKPVASMTFAQIKKEQPLLQEVEEADEDPVQEPNEDAGEEPIDDEHAYDYQEDFTFKEEDDEPIRYYVEDEFVENNGAEEEEDQVQEMEEDELQMPTVPVDRYERNRNDNVEMYANCQDLRGNYSEEELQSAIDAIFEGDPHAFLRFIPFKNQNCNGKYVYICLLPECRDQFKFTSKEGLSRHVFKAHFGNLRLFECLECGLKHYFASDLARHQVHHKRRFECDMPGMVKRNYC